MRANRRPFILFTGTLLAAWGVFALAQDASPRDPCDRAPNVVQVELAARGLTEATRAITEPLEVLADRLREDHELRENSALQNAAIQLLRFIREARSLDQNLSESAAQGRPTAADVQATFRVRRLLNRADRAFTLILTTWPGLGDMTRPVFAEYSNELRPYRELTYKIILGNRCNP